MSVSVCLLEEVELQVGALVLARASAFRQVAAAQRQFFATGLTDAHPIRVPMLSIFRRTLGHLQGAVAVAGEVDQVFEAHALSVLRLVLLSNTYLATLA